MKRKKIYSLLALGMAMSLAVSVPVSAAVSPTAPGVTVGDILDNDDGTKSEVTDVNVTENADGSTTTTVEEIIKNDAGDIVGGKTTETTVNPDNSKKEVVEEQNADGSDVRRTETAVNSNGQTTELVKTNTKSDSDIINQQKESATVFRGSAENVDDVKEASAEEIADIRERLDGESLGLLNKVNVKDIKVDQPGLKLTVSTVRATVQHVARDAATKMAAKMAAAVGADAPEAKSIDLLASAEIRAEGMNGRLNITIPLKETVKPNEFSYFVLHYIERTGEWETVEAQVTEEGIVIAAFDSLSPVFVVRAPKLPETEDPDNGNNNSSNDSSDDNSGSDEGSSNDSGSNSSSSSVTAAKAGNTPASVVPSNPAVSPKTGEE